MKIARKIFVPSLIAILVVALAFYGFPRISSTRRTAERYAVYADYLEAGRTGESHDLGEPKGLVLILDHTSNGMFRLLWSRQGSRWGKWDMLLRNVSHAKLERRFNLQGEYKLVASVETSSLSTSEFSRSYGVITFSDVTFSNDLTRANFYTEHICGLCGGGRFVTMQKVNGMWKIIDEDWTWIS